MQFQDIQEGCDNKQRINLSNHAYETLLWDAEVFLRSREAMSLAGRLSSTIVNRILQAFRAKAQSSIAAALSRREHKLRAMLDSMSNPQAREEALKLCLLSAEEEYKKKAERRLCDKQHAFSIRINKSNLKFLASKEGLAEGGYYRGNVGKYVKAVVEEYCELPNVRRERIFLKSNFAKIERAISERKLLKLTLHRPDSPESVNVWYMKPLCLQEDTEHLYNYVAGMVASSQSAPSDEWKMGSYRLTNIKEIAVQAHPGRVSEKSAKEIEAAIKKCGIQFLSAVNTKKIVVQLTPRGEKMYSRILHLRPSFVKKEGSVYEFDCSWNQADFYFFKFGPEAKILEPKHLADDFNQRYQRATAQYESQVEGKE